MKLSLLSELTWCQAILPKKCHIQSSITLDLSRSMIMIIQGFFNEVQGQESNLLNSE